MNIVHRHRSRPLPLSAALALLLGLGLAGCQHHYDDEGQACLLSSNDPHDGATVTPDEAKITVYLDDCLRCGEEEKDSSCTATVQGDEIYVTSSITTLRKGGNGCGDICRTLSVDCELSEPLSEGTYTIFYGDHEYTATLPGEPVCASSWY